MPNLGASPIDQGVILSPSTLNESPGQESIFWQSLGAIQTELATSYTVQWSTDPLFGTITGSKSYPATGGFEGTWILNGLQNTQVLYFRDQGVAGIATSPWSQVAGPITVGEPAGSVTVSGNVTFANAAAGPLYISFSNLATHQTFYTAIANPVSPQHYSIQLPADGSYSFLAFIDQNNDNIYDLGDMIEYAAEDVYDIAVTGPTATQDMTLQGGGNSIVSWHTENDQYVNDNGSTRQNYRLLALTFDGSKKLEALELTSGPNAIVPQDLARGIQIPYLSFFGSFNLVEGATPKVGDSCDLRLTYSDGSQETVTEKVTSVPGSFGPNPTPTGTGTSLTPTFSWTDPPNASTYVYNFDGPYWSIPASGWGTFSSSIDSITWGVDPTGGSNLPSAPSLTSGEYYQWEVDATDSSNNASNLTVGYYPGYARVYLPTANPSTLGAATVGQSYTGSIVATNGTAPYTFTVTGLSDGLTYSSSGGTLTISGTPLAAGTITFQVYVIDSTNASWGPVTYTINVGN